MIKQSMDYDPDGDYLRVWVPEIKALTGANIHSPWLLSSGALSAAHISLGETYPHPVVVAPEWSRHQKGGKAKVKLDNMYDYALYYSILM